MVGGGATQSGPVRPSPHKERGRDKFWVLTLSTNVQHISGYLPCHSQLFPSSFPVQEQKDIERDTEIKYKSIIMQTIIFKSYSDMGQSQIIVFTIKRGKKIFNKSSSKFLESSSCVFHNFYCIFKKCLNRLALKMLWKRK